jgi:lipopolysaccharide O-acetyltransferase
MKKRLKNYTISGIVSLIINKLYTKLFYANCRIIRRPFYIRGKEFVKFGDGFTTGVGTRIDVFKFGNTIPKLEIGKNVQINDYVHLACSEELIIEDNVLIASKVFITDHSHGNYDDHNSSSPDTPPNDRKIIAKPVLIEQNVWIGEFVSILPGVTISKGSIIGANSVVSKSIPAYSIAVGSPAKVIKKYNFKTQKWQKIKY